MLPKPEHIIKIKARKFIIKISALVQSTFCQLAYTQTPMTITNTQFPQQSLIRIIHEQQTKCKFNEMGLKQQQNNIM
jgi:hypothetical protein